MAKSKTREEFIADARAVHGDKYDYSLVKYVNSTTRIKIICPKHGVFEQLPYAHLRGQHCPKCALDSSRSTTDDFVNKAKIIHGDKYDYSLVKYVNSTTKIKIICPKHGVFETTPGRHLNNKIGCPKCNGGVKYDTNEFLRQAKDVHGDKYDYSKAVYKNALTKVEIICPVHGSFFQIPRAHIHLKQGCPRCKKNVKDDLQSFLAKAKNIHGGKYDYSKAVYTGSLNKLVIVCPIHGEFEQTPQRHLRGCGCSLCAIESSKKTIKEFIQEAKAVHGDKYDYSKAVYTGCEDKLEIICPEHGSFFQTPHIHLVGKGCPECGKKCGKSEEECRQFASAVVPDKVCVANDRSVLYDADTRSYKELDIYFPELQKAIEFNGEFWHELKETTCPGYHDKKRKLCENAGIELLEITYSEWTECKENAKNKIKEFLKK